MLCASISCMLAAAGSGVMLHHPENSILRPAITPPCSNWKLMAYCNWKSTAPLCAARSAY